VVLRPSPLPAVATAFSVSCVEDFPGGTSPPPVTLGAGTRGPGVDGGVHSENVTGDQRPAQSPEVARGPTSHRARQAENLVKKWYAVAAGKVPGIHSAWECLDGANEHVS
jgi:hypothetical protein